MEFDLSTFLNVDEHGNAVAGSAQQEDDDVERLVRGVDAQIHALADVTAFAEKSPLPPRTTTAAATTLTATSTVTEKDKEEDSVASLLSIAHRRRRLSTGAPKQRNMTLDTQHSTMHESGVTENHHTDLEEEKAVIVISPGRRRLSHRSLVQPIDDRDDGTDRSHPTTRPTATTTAMNKEKSNTAKPGIKFAAWWLKPIQVRTGVVLVVEGLRRMDDGTNQLWHSSLLEKRINAKEVQSKSGSIYYLSSDYRERQMRDYGFPSRFIRLFKNGFPENWREVFDLYIKGEMNGDTPAKGVGPTKKLASVKNEKPIDKQVPSKIEKQVEQQPDEPAGMDMVEQPSPPQKDDELKPKPKSKAPISRQKVEKESKSTGSRPTRPQPMTFEPVTRRTRGRNSGGNEVRFEWGTGRVIEVGRLAPSPSRSKQQQQPRRRRQDDEQSSDYERRSRPGSTKKRRVSRPSSRVVLPVSEDHEDADDADESGNEELVPQRLNSRVPKPAFSLTQPTKKPKAPITIPSSDPDDDSSITFPKEHSMTIPSRPKIRIPNDILSSDMDDLPPAKVTQPPASKSKKVTKRLDFSQEASPDLRPISEDSVFNMIVDEFNEAEVPSSSVNDMSDDDDDDDGDGDFLASHASEDESEEDVEDDGSFSLTPARKGRRKKSPKAKKPSKDATGKKKRDKKRANKKVAESDDEPEEEEDPEPEVTIDQFGWASTDYERLMALVFKFKNNIRSPTFWDDIAEHLESRSAEECQERYHQSYAVTAAADSADQQERSTMAHSKNTTAASAGSHGEQVVITGRKGTMLRKRQMRQLLEQRQEQHMGDDIFEADEDGFKKPAPKKPRSVGKESGAGGDEEEEEEQVQTPVETPVSKDRPTFTPGTSSRTGTPDILIPFDPTEKDAYIANIKPKGGAGIVGQRKKAVSVSNAAGKVRVGRDVDRLMKRVMKGEKAFAAAEDVDDDDSDMGEEGDANGFAMDIYADEDED